MPKDLTEKNNEKVPSIARVKADVKRKDERESSGDFQQKILDLVRVARVTSGGKKMRFRACIAIGDKNGKVGIGVSKGSDVSDAIAKAVSHAQKTLVDLSIYKGIIPHEVHCKYKAASVFLKPGRSGNGIIAGGIIRNILELAGFKDVVGKKMGTGNNINTAYATVNALQDFKAVSKFKK